MRILYDHVDVQLARQIVPLQQCVTLLRDPVDRLISYYAFAKHMNSGPHSELARRTTITQWIDALCLPERQRHGEAIVRGVPRSDDRTLYPSDA